MITEKQKLFLRLKIVEGKKYDEIQEILDKSRKTLGFWWKDLKAESNALRIVVDKWKKKCPEIVSFPKNVALPFFRQRLNIINC